MELVVVSSARLQIGCIGYCGMGGRALYLEPVATPSVRLQIGCVECKMGGRCCNWSVLYSSTGGWKCCVIRDRFWILVEDCYGSRVCCCGPKAVRAFRGILMAGNSGSCMRELRLLAGKRKHVLMAMVAAIRCEVPRRGLDSVVADSIEILLLLLPL